MARQGTRLSVFLFAALALLAFVAMSFAAGYVIGRLLL